MPPPGRGNLTVFMVPALLLATVLGQAPSTDPAVWVARLLTHTAAWERYRHQGSGGWRWEGVNQTLARDGHVEETETETYEAVRVEGRAFLRLVKRNGSPPSRDVLRKQEQQEAEFARRTREAREHNRPLPEDEDHISFDATFLARFAFTFQGTDQHSGRDCVVLSFKGRSDAGMTLRPQETVLRRLEGRLWLAQDDGGLVRLEAGLPQPVSVGLIAARVESLSISYEQQKGPQGLWVPARYEMTLHGRALIKRLDSHSLGTWTFLDETPAAFSATPAEPSRP
jgi:hypothetical protein